MVRVRRPCLRCAFIFVSPVIFQYNDNPSRRSPVIKRDRTATFQSTSLTSVWYSYPNFPLNVWMLFFISGRGLDHNAVPSCLPHSRNNWKGRVKSNINDCDLHESWLNRSRPKTWSFVSLPGLVPIILILMQRSTTKLKFWRCEGRCYFSYPTLTIARCLDRMLYPWPSMWSCQFSFSSGILFQRTKYVCVYMSYVISVWVNHSHP